MALSPQYLASIAAKNTSRFIHKGPSGHVYKSDHALSDSERKQIDDYDRANPPNLPPAPDRQPAIAGAPIKRRRNVATGIGPQTVTGTPVSDEESQIGAMMASNPKITREQAQLNIARSKGAGAAAVFGANQLAEKIAGATAPVLGPVGEAVGAAFDYANPLSRHLGVDAAKIGKDVLPGLAGQAASMPVQMAAEVTQLLDPQASAKDKAGAIANIAMNVLPVEELAVGGIGKAIKVLKAGGPAKAKIAQAIEETIASGVNPSEIEKAFKIPAERKRPTGIPKAPKLTQEAKPPTPNTPKAPDAPQTSVKQPETASVKESQTTGLANQVQDREAIAGIIDQVEPTKGKPAEYWQSEGKKAVDAGKYDPEQLAQRIGSGEEELTGEKVGVLLEGKRKLQNALNSAAPGEEYNLAKERLQKYLDNVQQGKGRWSDVGRSLQAGTELDTGNFARVLEEVKKRGSKLSAKQEAELKNLSEQVAAKDQQIADLEKQIAEGNVSAATNSAKANRKINREKIVKEIDDLWEKLPVATAKLSAGLDPEALKIVGQLGYRYVKLGTMTVDDIVRTVIEKAAAKGHNVLREDVLKAIHGEMQGEPRTKTDLQKTIEGLKRDIKNELEAPAKANAAQTKAQASAAKAQARVNAQAAEFIRKGKEAEAEKLLKGDKERLAKIKKISDVYEQIAEYQRQLDEGDYVMPTKAQRVTDNKIANLRAERDLLSRKVQARIKATSRPAILKGVEAVAGTVRGLNLGSDIGALTRQTLFGISRPKEYAKAISNGFKGVVSEKNLIRIESEIANREINGVKASIIRKKAGLSMSEHLTEPEELIFGKLIGKIPVVGQHLVGRLDRFQTGLLNSFRADLFDSAVAKGFTEAELKTRAQFINSSTGRSNAKHVPELLQAVLTSPRYERSRWEMLARPLIDTKNLGKGLAHGKWDRGAAANLQDMVITAGSVYGLYKLAEKSGWETNFDPESSDFLKLRKGDQVWDVSAGLAPRLRDMIGMVHSVADPDSRKNNFVQSAGKAFVRSVSPAVKTPVELGSFEIQRRKGVTEDKIKSPFSGYADADEEKGWMRLAPLIYQGIKKELEKPNGDPFGFWWKEFIGGSVNSYPKKK